MALSVQVAAYRSRAPVHTIYAIHTSVCVCCIYASAAKHKNAKKKKKKWRAMQLFGLAHR